jgi:hypothetical protein
MHLLFRLVNQRLLEVQSQVEELQKSLQDQGSKAEDVSFDMFQPCSKSCANLGKPVVLILFLKMCVSCGGIYVCVPMYSAAHLWRSEDSLWELLLPCVVRIGGECLYH